MRRTSSRPPRTSISPLIARARQRVHGRRGFRPALSWLEDRTLLATVTWASGVSGDWDNPAMWTGGAVPGPGDDAVIPFGDITVTHSSPASDSVNSLTMSSSDSALDLSNGSLALATTSSTAGELAIEGATLSTAGDLTVDGSMTWVGGTIAGGGSLAIASGATLSLSNNSSAIETLDGVVLENAGATSVSPAYNLYLSGLALENGAGIDNQPSGSFTLLTSAEISSDDTATFFTNEGSLIDVSGQTTIQPAFTQAAVSRRQAACWARRRTWRPSRPAARWTGSMSAPTCSAWGRSSVRSSRGGRLSPDRRGKRSAPRPRGAR